MHRNVTAQIDGDVVHASGYTSVFEPFTAADDSDLVASVSRREDISTDAARSMVAEGIDNICQSLDLDGSYALGYSGTLVRQGSDIVFVAGTDVETQWLADLAIKPLQRAAADTHNDDEETVQRREAFLRSLRRTASSAAAVCTLALLAFIFSQLPQNNGDDDAISASVAPTLAISPKGGVVTPVTEQPLVLILNTPSDASCEVTEEAALPSPKTAGDDSVPKRYCMIVASLTSRAEAMQFISDNGSGLHLLESDGRYRIYSHTADSYGELQAQADASDIYRRFPNAWICRR